MAKRLVGAVLALLAAVAVLGWVEAGVARAESAQSIDEGVEDTLARFRARVNGGSELLAKARGILVFPSVVKAGFGFGGEYGEGALIVNGQWGGYYNTVSASVGFQLGVEARSVIILFMTEEALYNFRRTYGWKVGVDGSVAIITVGAGAAVDSNKIASPVIGFILNPKGLMYNLTLEGTKITQISR